MSKPTLRIHTQLVPNFIRDWQVAQSHPANQFLRQVRAEPNCHPESVEGLFELCRTKQKSAELKLSGSVWLPKRTADKKVQQI